MKTLSENEPINSEQLAKLERLSHFMDKAFTVPGTSIQVGADSIIGLIPVIGDTLTISVSGYIYSFAKKAGVPWHKRMRMLWNIFVDWLIGLIPLAGDIFDVGFKANSKNVHIIKSHVANHQKEDGLDVEPDRSVHH